MKFEIEFPPPDETSRSMISVVLNSVGRSPTTGLPLVTKSCRTLDELEVQLQQIETQFGKIPQGGGGKKIVPDLGGGGMNGSHPPMTVVNTSLPRAIVIFQ